MWFLVFCNIAYVIVLAGPKEPHWKGGGIIIKMCLGKPCWRRLRLNSDVRLKGGGVTFEGKVSIPAKNILTFLFYWNVDFTKQHRLAVMFP